MPEMGPLQQFVDDPSIQDIAINGPDEVWFAERTAVRRSMCGSRVLMLCFRLPMG
jgi:type IV secretory pathway ATPase VirB11/archaellum biosynthesis ATPase